ncbi:sensor histidine kinase [Paenibacillus sp. 1011MAR3C5]|uniref:sensor histidine kinase n=1 Tax=Paenibacillus sp. 1011MAR3C5 TaxID=1675787 RepID=UPI000E6CBB10|nr:histidine kinase [Paenibacillus sp. 1011MAR3C5]RJE86173.1 sensor histidine kinase [Paenibacillus sp. 1011MAR3C5]
MKEREIRPENWTLLFKLVLLLYVTGSINLSVSGLTGWYTAAILLYISLDLFTHIMRSVTMQRVGAAVSVLFIIAISYELNPILTLLIPVNLHKLAVPMLRHPAPVLLLMLAPILLLPKELYASYGLAAAVSYLFLAVLSVYADKSRAYRSTLESIREEQYRLKRQLQESLEHRRQSEYMFKLEERNRLSQEIHDRIGHSMTGALIQMEAAKRLYATDAVRSAELLQNAIHISKDGIEQIRQVLKSMKPLNEQLGMNRMRVLADEFAATHEMETQLTHEGDLDRIEPLHWRIIQQNVTEALTNTVKYAEATAVSIHIQVLHTMIKASVSDNGAGASKVIKGLGMIGMEERTAAVSGKIIVDGSKGFTVTTLIPLASA